MGIAYLLSHPDVQIVGVTTVHGLTSAEKGAKNVRRLLHRLGAGEIPVYAGAEFPIGRPCAFPTDWRTQTELLPGVNLPPLGDPLSTMSAVDFIASQLRSIEPPTILALGPWTNIEQAMQLLEPAIESESIRLFAMGGAIDTHGNVFPDAIGGATDPHAEWNFYLDPIAVSRILERGILPTLVPLDATRTAAIRRSLISALSLENGTEASRLVREVIGSVENWIDEGHYFAWDAVAAVLLLNPEIGSLCSLTISIDTEGDSAGRIRRCAGALNAMCFMNSDIDRFEVEFVSTLLRSIPSLSDEVGKPIA